MGIPIITELNREITRLYIAGSPLAKGDPRITKYIQPLSALGQRAPVFQALAAKLTELTGGAEQKSPEQLMEAGMLVHSVINTQGSTEVKEPAEPVHFAVVPLHPEKLPYSRLHLVEQVLTSQSQEHSSELTELFETGRFRDPRLYPLYCQAVTERKSFISSFVAEQIIPAVGSEMIPFVEQELNLSGTKRDARLFKALYQIKGKDILSLSLKALEEGAEPVVAEALYTMCEDDAYEDILLRYANAKKSDLRQAACTALERMGSLKAEDVILEALSGKTAGFLQEVLLETGNPVLVRAVLETVQQEMAEFTNKSVKLRHLLEVLVQRDEREGLDCIRHLFLKNDKFDAMLGPLELHQLIRLLDQQDTPEKNRLLFEIAGDNPVFMEYKYCAAKRLFSKDKVYELCEKDCAKNTKLVRTYMNLYNFYGSDENRVKDWDRRWGHLFIRFDHLDAAFKSLYDDDTEGWTNLMERVAERIRGKKNSPLYYLGYLKALKQNCHPKFEVFYQLFLELGCPKETLAARLE